MIRYLRIFYNNRSEFVVPIVLLFIGITITYFALSYVYFENNYDTFHQDSDRIYRPVIEFEIDGEILSSPLANRDFALQVEQSISSIESATRITPKSDNNYLKVDQHAININDIIYADSNFFKFFSFPLIYGTEKSVLVSPNSIVITQELAQKVFGEDESEALGKRVQLNNQDYYINGIVKNQPKNSHLKFDAVIPQANNYLNRINLWQSANFYTYIKVYEGSNISDIEENINRLVNKKISEEVAQSPSQGNDNIQIKYWLSPLVDTHLNTEYSDFALKGNKSLVSLLILGSSIAIFISLFNYLIIQLRKWAINRQKIRILLVYGASEITIRTFQVFDILFHFLIASLLAGLTYFLLRSNYFVTSSYFNSQFHYTENFSFLGIYFLGLIVIVFLSYIILYKLTPLHEKKSSTTKKFTFGRLSLGIQVAISILMIMLSASIINRIINLNEIDLGYDMENVYLISNSVVLGPTGIKSFQNELNSLSWIKSAGYSSWIMDSEWQKEIMIIGNDRNLTNVVYCDTLFFSALNIKIDPKKAKIWQRDTTSQIIISKSNRFSWANDLNYITRPLNQGNMDYYINQIVSPVALNGMDISENPTVFLYNPYGEKQIYIKTSGRKEGLINAIQLIWGKFTDVELEFQKLSAIRKEIVHPIIYLKNITLIIAFTSIMNTIIGLAYYIKKVENDRLHIYSIKKVLGAKVQHLFVERFKVYFTLVVLSSIVGVASYFFIQPYIKNLYDYSFTEYLSLIIISIIAYIILILVVMSLVMKEILTTNPLKFVQKT